MKACDHQLKQRSNRCGQSKLCTFLARLKGTRRPVSRVLFAPCGVWQPFLWDTHCWMPHATHPGHGRQTTHMCPLLGLAPGGVCLASPVARPAVGSYPTLSPLPSCAEASEGGLLSVALSLGLRRAAVSRRPVFLEPGLSSSLGLPPCQRLPGLLVLGGV